MKPTDRIHEMNAYYDRRAPEHDRLMSYTDNKSMEAYLKPIIDLIEPHITDRKILEVACGTGNWTQVLAKRARSVLATDINESVLEIARKKPCAGRVEFLQHDAYALHKLRGEFDVAFAADWWSHIPKSAIHTFQGNLHRALSPGAVVIMLDMTLNDYFRNEPSTVDLDGNRLSRRKTPDGTEHSVVKNFPTESELRETIRDVVSKFDYLEDDKLERWLMIYKLRS